MQDAPGVDAVERAVVEGQRFCVRRPDLGLEAFEREPSAYELDGMLGEVDTRRDRPGAYEADEVGAQSDADLEQPLATSALEIGEAVDVGVEHVAGALDLSKELRRSFRRRRVLRAAGLLLPEAPDPRLLICSGRRRRHRAGLY